MLRRYWIAWVGMLLVTGGAWAQSLATVRVVDVLAAPGDTTVVVAAGSREGMAMDVEVTLLREAEPIIHPLTDEVLGVPQEPVGVIHVFAVEEHRSRGTLVKAYSPPRIGDLAEYGRQAALEERAPAPPPEVEQVMDRVADLEQSMAQYRKSQKALTAYPVFAQQVWDELNTVKRYLVSIDERLVSLESRQVDDRGRLESALRGEYRPEDVREFTFRYGPGTDVRLRVAGKTLLLDVVADTVRLVPASAADGGVDMDLPPVDEPQGEGMDFTWLRSPYVQGGSLAVIGVLGAILYLLMRRREDSAMADLEDFDEDYEDEEEEE